MLREISSINNELQRLRATRVEIAHAAAGNMLHGERGAIIKRCLDIDQASIACTLLSLISSNVRDIKTIVYASIDRKVVITAVSRCTPPEGQPMSLARLLGSIINAGRRHPNTINKTIERQALKARINT
jgi:hypothetical protein